MTLKTKVIFNPAANKGGCSKAWPRIRARIEEKLGAIDASATKQRGDGTTLAREAFRQGCRRFVVAGGDGTLNEVVNGLVENDRLLASDIVFAQIPAGTSNGISQALGHGGRGVAADRAFDALDGGQTRPLDIFRADCTGMGGGSFTRYGILLATLGAPATVGRRAGAVPLLKRMGPFAYVLTAVATAVTYRPRAARMVIDGDSHRDDMLWGALLCSAETAGEGLLLAPGARIDDGYLDLVAVGPLTRREALLQIIPKLADGSYCDHAKVTRQLTRDLSIESDAPVPVDVDGESIGTTPLRVRMLPEKLRIAVAV